MRLLQFLPRFEEGEKPAHTEPHNRDDEGMDAAFAAVPERVPSAGGLAGTLAADQEQKLVTGIGDGVDGFGQHGRGSRQEKRNEFRDAWPGSAHEHRTFSGVLHTPLTCTKPADNGAAVC